MKCIHTYMYRLQSKFTFLFDTFLLYLIISNYFSFNPIVLEN